MDGASESAPTGPLCSHTATPHFPSAGTATIDSPAPCEPIKQTPFVSPLCHAHSTFLLCVVGSPALSKAQPYLHTNYCHTNIIIQPGLTKSQVLGFLQNSSECPFSFPWDLHISVFRTVLKGTLSMEAMGAGEPIWAFARLSAGLPAQNGHCGSVHSATEFQA